MSVRKRNHEQRGCASVDRCGRRIAFSDGRATRRNGIDVCGSTCA